MARKPTQSKATPAPNPLTYSSLLEEINEAPPARQKIISQLERELGGRSVVTYFTSFRYPVMMDDSDADILEDVLKNCDLSQGLVLVINSPGGDGLAAEKIVTVCRAYTNGDFEVLVPKRAKSAATMVCLGAKKIRMSKTSELSAIDPQVIHSLETGEKRISVHSIVESYRELLTEAVNCEDKNITPYLQQLAHYNYADIKELEKSQKLVEKMAVDILKTGMMSSFTKKDIAKKIRVFTDPSVTGHHGRGINLETARKCGLNIEEINAGSRLWQLAWELYVRTDHHVSRDASKVIETKEYNFIVPAPS